ncbi:MAG: hypothetical protein BA863_06600 [Desulfovibrio sp. S3730MH75]|nr:MAG: hypothetical protein BA863_06600 [Desulfovibrio sp. S3730MH75]
MKIKNWNKFQHFKDRRPPWIKLYHDLLDNYEWFSLSDKASKALISIWLIASEYGGILPSAKDISWRLRLSASSFEEIMGELISHGFIENNGITAGKKIIASDIAEENGFGSRHISKALRSKIMDRDGNKCTGCESLNNLEIDHIVPISRGGESVENNLQVLCRSCNRKKRAKIPKNKQAQVLNSGCTDSAQRAGELCSPETEAYKEEGEAYKEEGEEEETIVEQKPLDLIKKVIDYLNEKAGKRYQARAIANRKHISARIKEGYQFDDFAAAIDNQVVAWMGTPRWEKYLRPSTLFNSEKFDGYVNNTNSIPSAMEDLTKGERTILTLNGGGQNGMAGRGSDGRGYAALESKTEKPARRERDPYNLGGVGAVVDAEYWPTDRQN